MSRNMEGFTDGAAPIDARESDQDQARQATRNTISLGMDMENFLRSAVGKYLSARAEVEISEIREKLDDLDPVNSENIRDLQQEIAVRKIWKDWILEAVQAGEVAQEDAIERNSL